MSIVVEAATKRFGDFVALDEVSITVPDINVSLAAVRTARASREKAR